MASMSISEDMTDDTVRAQQLQNRLYYIMDKLQQMSKELPSKYQQRINLDLLSGLANCLLHDTVFEIVKGLKEIQDVTEKHLFQNRLGLVEKQRAERHSLQLKQHSSSSSSSSDKTHKALQIKQKLEMKQNDMKTITQLDQKVSDQQVMLEKAGVPGFFVTNNPTEIRLQMYLLEFILRIWDENNGGLPKGVD